MIEHTVKVRALFLVRSEGTNFWYLNDQLHREDGPAIEDSDGRKEWWLNGKQVTEEEHRQQTRPTCNGKTVEIDGETYVSTLKVDNVS